MRPKKRILLIDSDEDRQGVRRFLLVTHAFDVTTASSAEQAIASATEKDFDLVLCAWPLDGIDAAKLLPALRAVNPYCPSMIVAETCETPPALGFAYDTLLFGRVSAMDLIERVKTMSARKRGPRKKPVMPVDPATGLSDRRIA